MSLRNGTGRHAVLSRHAARPGLERFDGVAAPDAVASLVPRSDHAGHMAFVRSVLDGTLPGYVLCDDLHEPSAAFVCNANGFYHAIGAPTTGFAAAAVAAAIDAIGDGEPAGLWAWSEAWSEVLAPLFETALYRNEYRHDGIPVAATVPRGFTLRPLDAGLAGRLGDGLDDWVVTTFGGAQRFAMHSFGLAALDGENVAGFCAGCAFGNDGNGVEVEIEIATAEAYRGAGLAVATGSAFIIECHRRGIRPAWTCDTTNEASDRTARRLGFQFRRRIAGFPVRKGMIRRNGQWRLGPG